MIPGLKRRVFNFYDVMMYVAIARKHLRLMLLLMCLTCMGSLVYYVFARPVFYARSLVRVESIVPLPVDEETVFHDSNMRAVVMQLQAPYVIERTAQKLGVKKSAREIQRKVIKKVAIRLTSDKNLEIEVWGYLNNMTVKWAETLVGEFLKFREEKRIQYRALAVKAYNDEMARIGEQLDKTLESKFNFRDEKDLTRAEIEENLIRAIPHEVVHLKQQLSQMESVRANLAEPGLDIVAKLSLIASMDKEIHLNLGQIVGATPDTKPDVERPTSDQVVVVPSVATAVEPWEAFEREQRRIQSEIADASKIYLPGHKKMIALRKQLDEVNRHLDLEYQFAKNRFDLKYQSLIDRVRELEAKLPEYQEISKKYAKVQQESALHDAGELAWNNMFGTLAKNVKTLDFAEDKERINLEYLGLMEQKDTPVSPNRFRIVLIAFFLGGVLGIGVPLLIEYLDHTISNVEQVETTFQMRGLGIIPQITASESERPALLNLEASDERNLVENFRVIRTNLLSMGTLTKNPCVIMTTSAMPKEGKTVVSSNLAISFAQMGAKTLIIDTDLRRGRLHRLFGLRKSPGLSNVLLNRITLDEALRPTGKEGLTIMTAGEHLETGTELLGSEKFTNLMQELRGRYDRVIMDTPPVLGLSETSILQNHVDGVLFVIWSGRTPIRNMKTAIDMLQANGANFYGFVLNRLDLSATTNYYQYYYYSNDYYHSYHALENA